jgi:hypothetical protein
MNIMLFNPAPQSDWQARRRVELPLSFLCIFAGPACQGYKLRIVGGCGFNAPLQYQGARRIPMD